MCQFYLARSMDLMHGGCLSCINGTCSNYLSPLYNEECRDRVGSFIKAILDEQVLIISKLRLLEVI